MKSLLSALSLLASVMASTVGSYGNLGCCDSQNGLPLLHPCHPTPKECLRPITGDAFTCNCILNKFTVTFGSVTAVDPVTGALTGFIDNSVLLQMFDNGEICSPCQESLYIRVNTASTTVVFNPALIHVLVFTPKTDATLEDIVCLYSIYALRVDPPALAIIPSVNVTNFSLNIQFPATYDFNGQTIIADYNTYATSAKIVADPVAVPPGFDVTITAEILKNPVVGNIPSLAAPATMVFDGYDARIPETKVILQKLDREIDAKCEIICPKEEQLCKLRCYVKQCEIIRKLSYKCARPKKTRISKKCLVYKYFAFVSNCLTVIPKICFKDNYVCAQKVIDTCCKCEDSYNVFCAILARLYVSISIEAQSYLGSFHALFESIVGLNVYCLPHKDFEKLYDLGSKDMEAVKGACPEETAIDEEKDLGTVEGGSESKDEEGKDDDQKSSGKKGGFAKYGWTIAIVVVVVAVISITAFALY